MARGVGFAEDSIRIRIDFERFQTELLACQALLDSLRLDIFDSHTFLNPENPPKLPDMRRLAQTRVRDRLGYYLEIIRYILIYQYSPDQSGHIHWSLHD